MVAEPEQVAQLLCEHEADDEAERRHPHREPERGPHDDEPPRGLFVVEVEAEERTRDPHLQEDREHRDCSRDDLDAAERSRREEVRVERQQESREDARHESAEPVDRAVPPEPLELFSESHL